jgi:hypothetical protein
VRIRRVGRHGGPPASRSRHRRSTRNRIPPPPPALGAPTGSGLRTMAGSAPGRRAGARGVDRRRAEQHRPVGPEWTARRRFVRRRRTGFRPRDSRSRRCRGPGIGGCRSRGVAVVDREIDVRARRRARGSCESACPRHRKASGSSSRSTTRGSRAAVRPAAARRRPRRRPRQGRSVPGADIRLPGRPRAGRGIGLAVGRACTDGDYVPHARRRPPVSSMPRGEGVRAGRMTTRSATGHGRARRLRPSLRPAPARRRR